MDDDELLDSWDKLSDRVDDVRKTIPTVISMRDINWRDRWRSGETYNTNDGVDHRNRMYVAIRDGVTEEPHDFGTVGWMALNSPNPEDSIPKVMLSADTTAMTEALKAAQQNIYDFVQPQLSDLAQKMAGQQQQVARQIQQDAQLALRVTKPRGFLKNINPF